MSVDPAPQGTGLAFWDIEDWGRLVPPIATANVYPKKADRWDARAWSTIEKIQTAMSPYHVVHAYLEQPGYFADAAGVMAAKTGSLEKLLYFFGSVTYMLHRAGISQTYYSVREWKGQLPKDVVERKILRLLPAISTMNIKSHSMCAVGIGLHAKKQIKLV
jgi:hypothetical protein